MHSINKLDENNYFTWVKDMKFLLNERNAWKIVEGTEVSPIVDEKDVKGSEAKVLDFENRSRAALTLIYMNVGFKYRSIIENANEPVEAWKLLSSYFQPDSKARHMSLVSELNSCFILPNENVSLFSARLRNISDQLKDIGHPMEETYVVFQFLRYLPDKFDQIVQSILRWPDKKFNLKDVTLEVAAEETRLKLRDVDRGKMGKLIEVQTTTASNSSFRYKNVICFRCGRKGHIKRFCRVNLNNRSPSPSNNSNSSSCSNKSNFYNESKSRNFDSDSSFSSNNKSKSRKKHISRKLEFQVNKPSSHLAESNFNKTQCDDGWVFDTAASHHFCRNIELFDSYTPVRNEEMHVAVDGMTFPIHGKGTILMGFKEGVFKFKDVLYSPKLRRNLISGPKMDVEGAVFKGEKGRVRVYTAKGKPIFKARLMDGIYHVFPKIKKNSSNSSKSVRFEASSIQKNSLEVWHARLAHISPELIINTYKNNCVSGLPELKHKDFFCEPCQLNKQRRVSFKPLGFVQSKAPLERVYSDVWGPINVPGRNGEKYFLSIIDDFSRKTVVYPFQDKSQVFSIFQKHIARAERFLNTKLKFLRTDNGTEYNNDRFRVYCEEAGIQHEFTNTFTPEQNGPCERFNQTVLNNVRTILHESGMPYKFWPDAAIYFAYSWNRVCHKGQKVTPFQLYSGHKPSVKHLKAFGTMSYVGVPKFKRKNKLDVRAQKGRMVGYGLRTKGYRIWLTDKEQVIETINVHFKEVLEPSNSRSGAALGPLLDLESTFSDESETEFRFIQAPPPNLSRMESNEEDVSSGADTLESDVDSESDGSQPSTDRDLIPALRQVSWTRKAVPRKDLSRTDIYYYEEGKTHRLRSLNEVKTYCEKNNIIFEPSLFNFSGSNTYEGLIGPSGVPSALSTKSKHR